MQKALKGYFTGTSKLNCLLSVRNPFISANSTCSCRQLNVFPGLQATRIFDLAETVFKLLKVMLFTGGEINHKSQKTSVVNTSLIVQGRYRVSQIIKAELLLCSCYVVIVPSSLKTLN